MVLRVVFVVVDAEDDRHVRICGGRRDDHLRRAGVEVLARALPVGEEAGRLDDDVDVEITPGKRRRIALREHAELVLADDDRPVGDADVLVQLPEHGVVLEQVSHRRHVPEIVRSDDLEVPLTFQMRAEEVPPDAPKPVDPHPCLGHLAPSAVVEKRA